VPTIILKTFIAASADVCFDLMRDIRLHTETTMETSEKAVAGVTEGMIGLGQTVTFEGTHFGMKQRLKVKVVKFDRPWLFVDEMVEGRFKSFTHVHEFETVDAGTIMVDTLKWTSPFGVLGRLVDKLILERHLSDLVTQRNARLKRIAESQPA